MISNTKIIFTSLLICCYSPIKTTIISDNYDKRPDYQNELVIYFSSDEIKREYTEIASIKLSNKSIYGNMLYDKRITNYLIDEINQIGGNALIYNEFKSDKKTTYFEVIIFTEQKQQPIDDKI